LRRNHFLVPDKISRLEVWTAGLGVFVVWDQWEKLAPPFAEILMLDTILHNDINRLEIVNLCSN
jgi:hypothetical protein